MTKTKFMKGLLGASALTLLSAGSAFAQNNFTPADTDVTNTFNLTYNVGAVAQPPITNDTPGEETVFKVDRLVNVTVAPVVTTATYSPNQQDAFVDFTVRNDGNDDHPYFLGVEEVTGTDDFNADPSTSTDNIIYFRDTNDDGVVSGTELAPAAAIEFDATDPDSYPDIEQDEVILVRVVRDIPEDAEDGQESDIHLFADTRAAGSELDATSVEADGDSTNSTLVTENVLADLNGPADDATNDGTADGAHSATNTFVVLSADVSATKDVFVLDSNYNGTCTAIPGTYTPPAPSSDTSAPVPNNGYNIPNACVEYFITVRNDGSASATAIDLLDNLPDGLVFQSASLVGNLTGGTLATPAAGTVCTSAPVNCAVSLTAGTIAGKAAPADPPVEGHLVIRATIQ